MYTRGTGLAFSIVTNPASPCLYARTRNFTCSRTVRRGRGQFIQRLNHRMKSWLGLPLAIEQEWVIGTRPRPIIHPTLTIM